MRTTGPNTAFPTWLLALVVPVVAGGRGRRDAQRDRRPAARRRRRRRRRADRRHRDRDQGLPVLADPTSVTAGATVTVTNDDGTVHTLTADDGKFDTGDLDGGASGTITIDEPGTYAYFCDIHNYMTGTIEAT